MLKERALSYALAISFLSAVADRFGLWGIPGEAGVAWGSYENFLIYTKHLNSWAPNFVVMILGAIATFLEVVFAICLITGFNRRYAALGSSILLGIFAMTMILADGFKGPLDYGVWTASAGAFLLSEYLKKDLKTSKI